MKSRPDWVADAAGWSEGERAANRYDTLRRERLPLTVCRTELEWRVHPVEDVLELIANRKVLFVLFAAFFANAFLLGPLIRAFGAGLFSPVTYPVICLGCGFA